MKHRHYMLACVAEEAAAMSVLANRLAQASAEVSQAATSALRYGGPLSVNAPAEDLMSRELAMKLSTAFIDFVAVFEMLPEELRLPELFVDPEKLALAIEKKQLSVADGYVAEIEVVPAKESVGCLLGGVVRCVVGDGKDGGVSKPEVIGGVEDTAVEEHAQ